MTAQDALYALMGTMPDRAVAGFARPVMRDGLPLAEHLAAGAIKGLAESPPSPGGRGQR